MPHTTPTRATTADSVDPIAGWRDAGARDTAVADANANARRAAVGGTDLAHWLTNREREVAERAALGATNRQIADQLVVSIRTVEGHLLRAFVKLGVRTRAELVGALGVRIVDVEAHLLRCHSCGAVLAASSEPAAKGHVARRP